MSLPFLYCCHAGMLGYNIVWYQEFVAVSSAHFEYVYVCGEWRTLHVLTHTHTRTCTYGQMTVENMSFVVQLSLSVH